MTDATTMRTIAEDVFEDINGEQLDIITSTNGKCDWVAVEEGISYFATEAGVKDLTTPQYRRCFALVLEMIQKEFPAVRPPRWFTDSQGLSLGEKCPNCEDGDEGTCPRCFKETGLGCDHGPLCDDCQAEAK